MGRPRPLWVATLGLSRSPVSEGLLSSGLSSAFTPAQRHLLRTVCTCCSCPLGDTPAKSSLGQANTQTPDTPLSALLSREMASVETNKNHSCLLLFSFCLSILVLCCVHHHRVSSVLHLSFHSVSPPFFSSSFLFWRCSSFSVS